MDVGFLVYFSLALVSSLALLLSPYLRITSLGWFIAIWCIPYLGASMFILTVVRSRKASHDDAICGLVKNHEKAPCLHGRVEKLGVEYDFLPYFEMGSSSLIVDDEFVDEVCRVIKAAKQRVWVTTYILSGEVKARVLAELVEAHERGVDVKLLIDRIGSGLLTLPRGKSLSDALPFDVSVFHRSRIRSIIFAEKRLHSKIVLADNVGIVGAHNLRDEVVSTHEDSVHNVSVSFSGNVVSQLEAVFIDLWKLNENVTLLPLENSDESEASEGNGGEGSGVPARIIFSDPIERSHKYNNYISDLLYSANKRIYIWMPYIVPTHAMRRSIVAASKLGLDVRVLFPKISDSKVVDNAHALVLKEFVENGVNCAQSEGDFDHSKILIVDDLTIIGSTNLDYRSLYRNYEANIEVKDHAFTHSVVEIFDGVYSRSESASSCRTNALLHIRNQFTSLVAALY